MHRTAGRASMYQWESCGNLSPSVVLAPGHSMHEERGALIYDLSC
jgi:hypothetical protein